MKLCMVFKIVYDVYILGTFTTFLVTRLKVSAFGHETLSLKLLNADFILSCPGQVDLEHYMPEWATEAWGSSYCHAFIHPFVLWVLMCLLSLFLLLKIISRSSQ